MSDFKGTNKIACYDMQLKQAEEYLIILLHSAENEKYILNLTQYW
jgi:hypothetical protein